MSTRDHLGSIVFEQGASDTVVGNHRPKRPEHLLENVVEEHSLVRLLRRHRQVLEPTIPPQTVISSQISQKSVMRLENTSSSPS